MADRKKKVSTDDAADALREARKSLDESDEPWNDPSLKVDTGPRYDPTKDKAPPPKEDTPSVADDAQTRAERFARRNRKIEMMTRPIRVDK